MSGIYKGNDFFKGHYEKPPYDEQSKRTVYHVRNLEVFRLKQLSGKLDIFISHDWPTNITKFGNVKQLLKRKPFFKYLNHNTCLVIFTNFVVLGKTLKTIN